MILTVNRTPSFKQHVSQSLITSEACEVEGSVTFAVLHTRISMICDQKLHDSQQLLVSCLMQCGIIALWVSQLTIVLRLGSALCHSRSSVIILSLPSTAQYRGVHPN